ncbi:MAG: cation:proton antiporter, partial [Candidatus Woesearchaeota archaeon]|nr:cation:proton antiporter [Candidatus Woesearchaeota archaeon]
KVNLHFMKNLSRNSAIMAINAGQIPFFLGFFVTMGFTNDWIESLFVGIALAITAEDVSISILEELDLLKKRVGQLIIEAGIIGDIFELLAIALLGVFIRFGENFEFLALFLDIFGFIILLFLMRFYIVDWLFRIIGKNARRIDYFGVAFTTLLIMTTASELLKISPIIGALIAGLLLKDKLVKDKLYYEEEHIVEALDLFNASVFHPLIFIWIGLSIDLSLISQNIPFGLVLTGIALAGKLLGSILGNQFCGEPVSEGVLIGWGLNPRGATELFAVLIAQNQGFISQEIYASVVLMTLLTTIISPIMFKILVTKGYGLMEHNSFKEHSAVKRHLKNIKKMQ